MAIERLDVKDRKILHELDFGARQPLSRIARKVRLSQEVVSYRIKRLEEGGIITRYYTVIDNTKAGYMFCRFFAKLQNLTPETEKKLIEYTRKDPTVGWIVTLSGNWDIAFVIFAKTVADLKASSERISFEFAKNIKEKYISIATKIYHFKHNYLYGTHDTDELLWGAVSKKQDRIDEIDQRILQTISSDARKTSVVIASEVGLTADAVRRRIDNLVKKKIILAFRAEINIEKLGYQHQKLLLYTENMDLKEKNRIIEFLRQHQKVIYITEALGKSDLEFEIVTKNSPEFYDEMKKLLIMFPNTIRDYETMLLHKFELLEYFPET